MKLLFATHNPHKVQEIRKMLGSSYDIVSLADLEDHDEIEETGNSLEENALIKARTAFLRHHLPCFADDTGLEVNALCGAPGVHSARYATDGHDDQRNRAKLLTDLQGVTDRSARFRTVIALVTQEDEQLFEGIVTGTIMTHEEGEGGFGYDPIFSPKGYSQTFASMSIDEKNRISHRARALEALAEYLQSLLQ